MFEITSNEYRISGTTEPVAWSKVQYVVGGAKKKGNRLLLLSVCV